MLRRPCVLQLIQNKFDQPQSSPLHLVFFTQCSKAVCCVAACICMVSRQSMHSFEVQWSVRSSRVCVSVCVHAEVVQPGKRLQDGLCVCAEVQCGKGLQEGLCVRAEVQSGKGGTGASCVRARHTHTHTRTHTHAHTHTRTHTMLSPAMKAVTP
jgi:cold shock CspA family protein